MRSANVRSFPSGTQIFETGEPARCFYLVLSGAVKIYKLSPQGSEQVLAVFRPGQTFAEAAVLLGGRYPASTEALEDCELIVIDRDSIISIIQHDTEFCLRLLAGMALKLRHLVGMVEDLTLRDARGRVARYILNLTTENSPQAAEDVRLPHTQTVVARLLGLTGETLSRTLKSLREEGFIESPKPGHFSILDRGQLMILAGESDEL